MSGDWDDYYDCMLHTTCMHTVRFSAVSVWTDLCMCWLRGGRGFLQAGKKQNRQFCRFFSLFERSNRWRRKEKTLDRIGSARRMSDRLIVVVWKEKRERERFYCIGSIESKMGD